MTTTSTNTTGPTRSLQPGDRIDKYEVVEQIASGGMAVLWRGQDSMLKRPVAIKQIAPQLLARDPDGLRQQFRREAKLHKQIAANHKHLVKIYDFIDDERGLFIVMEFVSGQSLEQVLATAGGPLDARRGLGIAAATALGLQAIHQAGVLHRDLKPSNILLTADGGLKICDFGLATLIEEQDAPSLGTAKYMAPELHRGDKGDARSDIYSLGMITYEMLAGRPAFQEAFKLIERGQRDPARRWNSWHTNTRTTAPPLRELNTGVPPAVSELVGRMMEKDPVLRVGSAGELIDAIRRNVLDASGDDSAAKQSAAAPTAGAGGSTPVGDSAPTAELPGPPITMYVLGATLVVIIGVVLAVLGMQAVTRNDAQKQRWRDAAATYGEGLVMLEERRYEEARNTFDSLVDSQATDDDWELTRRSGAYASFASGVILEREGMYDDAAEAFADAREAGIFDEADSARLRARIDRNRRTSDHRALIAEIREMIAERRFGEARQRISGQLALSPPDSEAQVLRSLQNELEGAQVQAGLDQIIAFARSKRDAGDIDGAIAYIEDEMLQNRSPQLEETRDQLLSQKHYGEAMSRYRTARAADDLTAALAAMEEARAIRMTDEAVATIEQLKAEIAFQDGQAAEEAGDLAAAREFYSLALDRVPAAQAALDRIKTSEQREVFLSAARSAMRNGDYPQAVAQLDKALALRSDPRTLELRNQAQVRHHVATGQTLMAQDQLAQARAAFQAALELDGQDGEARTGLSETETAMAYLEAIAEGDRLRAAGDFGRAKTAYRRAREIDDSRDADERLTDVEYEHMIAKTREEIARGNIAQARTYLNLARSIRDTDQARALADEIGGSDEP